MSDALIITKDDMFHRYGEKRINEIVGNTDNFETTDGTEYTIANGTDDTFKSSILASNVSKIITTGKFIGEHSTNLITFDESTYFNTITTFGV